jgi:hypothetical protein
MNNHPLEINTRVLIESSPLEAWNGQTGTITQLDHPVYTVKLDRIAASARFEACELRVLG